LKHPGKLAYPSEVDLEKMGIKRSIDINIDRKEQGRILAQMNGSVKRNGETSYTVSSQSGNGSYDVICTDFDWNCSCPDSTYRGVKCKHIHAIEFSIVAAYHYRQAAESNVYMLMLPLTLLNDSQLCEAITSLKL
jgi:SWIM zinc finger